MSLRVSLYYRIYCQSLSVFQSCIQGSGEDKWSRLLSKKMSYFVKEEECKYSRKNCHDAGEETREKVWMACEKGDRSEDVRVLFSWVGK